MEPSSRTRLMTALVLAVVFGTGVLVGAAADTNLGAEAAEATAPAATGAEPEPERRTPMYTQVDPTEAQQALIDSIVRVHRERTNALDKEMRAALRQGFREILLQTRTAIKGVLGPEQAVEYQRILDEYDARQAAEREKGGDDEE